MVERRRKEYKKINFRVRRKCSGSTESCDFKKDNANLSSLAWWNRWTPGNLALKQVYVNWAISLQLSIKLEVFSHRKAAQNAECKTRGPRKFILCLDLASWKLDLYKAIPAFICSPHPAAHCFLELSFCFWDCHSLGTRTIPFVLTGTSSVFTLSLWSSVSLRVCWEIYSCSVVQEDVSQPGTLCGFRCVKMSDFLSSPV